MPIEQPYNDGLTDHGPRKGENLDTCEARCRAWAEWFGLEPAPIKKGRGKHAKSVLMNDAFMQWVHASGASLDWIVIGDVRTLAVAFRRSALMEQRMVEAIKPLDPEQLDLLKATMLLMARREIAAEDVVEAFKAGQAELLARKGQA